MTPTTFLRAWGCGIAELLESLRTRLQLAPSLNSALSKPDLLFLDVQMPDIDGFEVIAALETEKLPKIVFVTAYDQYALRAIEFHAFGYTGKPISPMPVWPVENRNSQHTAPASIGSLGDHEERDLSPLARRFPARAGPS
jgi:DNA-binding LytR/AlgR family response regulator